MTWIQTLAPSLTASGAVAVNRFVTFAGAQVSAVGGKAMGSALMAATVGQSFPVLALGIGEVESGGAVAVGDSIISDVQGRGIVSAATAGHWILGHATKATTAAGQTLEYLATPPVQI
jgi:hypothetical protein